MRGFRRFGRMRPRMGRRLLPRMFRPRRLLRRGLIPFFGPRRFLWRRGLWGRWRWVGPFLLLLFGSQALKLHQRDVQTIEGDTGKRAEDLTEEELRAAMKRLGIQRLELTDEERAAVEGAG